jgi:uncharacterized membrane protein
MTSKPAPTLGETLRRDLRAGVAVIVPFAVTAWALWWVFRFLDGVLGRAVEPLLPVRAPGLGLLLLFLGVLGVGALSRSGAGVRLIVWLDRRLSRVPLASWVYGTATQITHSTMDARGGTFKRCVMVEYPKEGSWALGFVTAQAPDVLREQLEVEDLICVFVPTTPNPTSGFLLLVPEAKTRDAGIATEAGFRLIISAGSIRMEASDVREGRRSMAEFLSRM